MCGATDYGLPVKHKQQGKIFNPNRLKEIIEIMQCHILYSFTEQSIKKIFSEQHAY